MFQRNVVATAVAAGSNPSWNEELCIPFRFMFLEMSSNEWFDLLMFSSRISIQILGSAVEATEVHFLQDFNKLP